MKNEIIITILGYERINVTFHWLVEFFQNSYPTNFTFIKIRLLEYFIQIRNGFDYLNIVVVEAVVVDVVDVVVADGGVAFASPEREQPLEDVTRSRDRTRTALQPDS